MSSVSGTGMNSSEFERWTYFCKEGLVFRANKKTIEVRNYKTTNWATTNSRHLIASVFEGKRTISMEKAEEIFWLFYKEQNKK